MPDERCDGDAAMAGQGPPYDTASRRAPMTEKYSLKEQIALMREVEEAARRSRVQLYTVAEVAAQFSVSERTIRRAFRWPLMSGTWHATHFTRRSIAPTTARTKRARTKT